MRIIRVLMILLSFALLLTTTVGAQDVESEKLYTAYNMWFEKPKSMHCINFKAGTMIPAGSLVSSAQLIDDEVVYVPGMDYEEVPPYIRFTIAEDKQEYNVQFSRRWHPGKSIQDYFDLMFTTRPLDERIAEFTSDEKQAIHGGYLLEGMSKEAVLIAYGYPPEHKTRNLTSNTWLYWRNKFGKKVIYFDPDGRTVKKERLEKIEGRRL